MAKRLIILALLTGLIIGTAFAQTARSHITEGQDHMREQKYAEAVASFEAALKLEPRNRQASTLLREAQEKRMEQTFNQAQGLHQAGNFADAITQYNLAIRFAPPGQNTRSIQSRRDEAQKALQEQEQQAQEATARDRSASSRQAVQRANELFISGQYTQAAAEYENAIGIGGLNTAEANDAQRLLKESQDIIAKIQSYSRTLRDDDFEVSQNRDGKITIVKYKATEKRTVSIGGNNHTLYVGILNVVIPARLYTTEVTTIGSGAFRDTGITSVVIPDTVVEIGAGAFSANKLERVTLGRAVRIIAGGTSEGQIEVSEPGAFEGNAQLAEVIIPNTVTEIGARAFRDCGLTSVTFGTGIQSIGESAFRNNKLTVMALPANLKTIRRYAFNNNQIQSLTIPNGVEIIYHGAFTNNPMTTLIIPVSLATLVRIDNIESPRIGGDHERHGDFIPSFPDSLTRVTLPANMHANNMKNFVENLQNFYISQNRVAGIYVKQGHSVVWARN
ncbi:MAG: leucine-rich repeat protein [Treponema sp.]|nr:leucine-rich repeat protein [Treponema sp.]